MTKCYDKSKNIFLPFENLPPKKMHEIGSLMRTIIDNLLEEMKGGKSNVDFMDILMLKKGVKKKMFQVRLNELFSSGKFLKRFQ